MTLPSAPRPNRSSRSPIQQHRPAPRPPVGALSSSYGWSEQFVDDIVLKTPDFNVRAGDRTFAEWLSATEMGLAIGTSLLAAVDEGLGTALLTGRRAKIEELLSMPDNTTVSQIQLIGYPAEGQEAGGRRPRPDLGDLYFEDTGGKPVQRDEEVVDELTQAGMLQPAAPLTYRKQEVRAPAAMCGLPD